MERADITADGVAAAAAALAVKSEYLDQNKDLIKTFWYFFDMLARHVSQQQAAKQAREDSQRRWLQCSAELQVKLGGLCYQLEQGYRDGILTRPLTELRDDEILSVRGIGPTRLRLIQEAITSS